MSEWIEIVRPWHDNALTHCALCGRLVPRRAWRVEIDGAELLFCNEECEGLYLPLAAEIRRARRNKTPREESTMEFSERSRFYWGNLTWDELRIAAKRKPVVVQPIGLEQHGYHLPLNTDNFIVTHLCDAAGHLAPDELLILPTIPFAFNAHHMDFPGVVAIRWESIINYLLDVVTSVTAHGFDRFIFISGHGVNPPYLAVVANEVNVRTGALCASLLWTALADNVNDVRESIAPGGMAHACELETAAMLHLDANRVRSDKIVDELGFQQGTFLQMDLGSATGVHLGEHWWSSFSPTGVAGEASKATAEKGRQMVERAAENLVALVRELRNRPDPAKTRVDRH